MSNKTFWRTVRPFLTHKGVLIDNEISLIHNGKTRDNEKQVAKTSNHAYINIVEHTGGIKPTSVLKGHLHYKTIFCYKVAFDV